MKKRETMQAAVSENVGPITTTKKIDCQSVRKCLEARLPTEWVPSKHEEFFETATSCLPDDELSLLQTIECVPSSSPIVFGIDPRFDEKVEFYLEKYQRGCVIQNVDYVIKYTEADKAKCCAMGANPIGARRRSSRWWYGCRVSESTDWKGWCYGPSILSRCNVDKNKPIHLRRGCLTVKAPPKSLIALDNPEKKQKEVFIKPLLIGTYHVWIYPQGKPSQPTYFAVQIKPGKLTTLDVRHRMEKKFQYKEAQRSGEPRERAPLSDDPLSTFEL